MSNYNPIMRRFWESHKRIPVIVGSLREIFVEFDVWEAGPVMACVFVALTGCGATVLSAATRRTFLLTSLFAGLVAVIVELSVAPGGFPLLSLPRCREPLSGCVKHDAPSP